MSCDSASTKREIKERTSKAGKAAAGFVAFCLFAQAASPLWADDYSNENPYAGTPGVALSSLKDPNQPAPASTSQNSDPTIVLYPDHASTATFLGALKAIVAQNDSVAEGTLAAPTVPYINYPGLKALVAWEDGALNSIESAVQNGTVTRDSMESIYQMFGAVGADQFLTNNAGVDNVDAVKNALSAILSNPGKDQGSIASNLATTISNGQESNAGMALADTIAKGVNSAGSGNAADLASYGGGLSTNAWIGEVTATSLGQELGGQLDPKTSVWGPQMTQAVNDVVNQTGSAGLGEVSGAAASSADALTAMAGTQFTSVADAISKGLSGNSLSALENMNLTPSLNSGGLSNTGSRADVNFIKNLGAMADSAATLEDTALQNGTVEEAPGGQGLTGAAAGIVNTAVSAVNSVADAGGKAISALFGMGSDIATKAAGALLNGAPDAITNFGGSLFGTATGAFSDTFGQAAATAVNLNATGTAFVDALPNASPDGQAAATALFGGLASLTTNTSSSALGSDGQFTGAGQGLFDKSIASNTDPNAMNKLATLYGNDATDFGKAVSEAFGIVNAYYGSGAVQVLGNILQASSPDSAGQILANALQSIQLGQTRANVAISGFNNGDLQKLQNALQMSSTDFNNWASELP